MTLDGGVAANILNKNMTNTMTNATTSAAFIVCQVEVAGSDVAFAFPSLTVTGSIYAGVATAGSPALPDQSYGIVTYYKDNTLVTPTTRGGVYAAAVNGYKVIFTALGGGTSTSGRQLQYGAGLMGNDKLIAAIHYNSNQAANATGIRAILNSMYNVFV